MTSLVQQGFTPDSGSVQTAVQSRANGLSRISMGGSMERARDVRSCSLCATSWRIVDFVRGLFGKPTRLDPAAQRHKCDVCHLMMRIRSQGQLP